MIDEKKLVEDITKYHNSLKPSYITRLVESIFSDVVDIINEQPKINEWIPVEERLPEKNEYVLIFDKYGRQYVWSLNESYGQYCWLDERCEWVAFNEVAAWMPLPAPYDMRKEVK